MGIMNWNKHLFFQLICHKPQNIWYLSVNIYEYDISCVISYIDHRLCRIDRKLKKKQCRSARGGHSTDNICGTGKLVLKLQLLMENSENESKLCVLFIWNKTRNLKHPTSRTQ